MTMITNCVNCKYSTCELQHSDDNLRTWYCTNSNKKEICERKTYKQGGISPPSWCPINKDISFYKCGDCGFLTNEYEDLIDIHGVEECPECLSSDIYEE